MQVEPMRILFVDDDPVTGSVIKRKCDSVGYNCSIFQSPIECLSTFEKEGADFIITDLRMPEMTGFELLNKIRAIDAEMPVLVMTGYSSVENAVEAMKLGATDFIKKPFDFNELNLILDRTAQARKLKDENRLLKKRLDAGRNNYGMIGDTSVMKTLFNTIEKVANVNCNVIITGESGTGKELVAKALHDYSPRKDAPFVVIDCGALTETLLESELFGHEKGAFTGATQRKRGLMEQASGGTLFLDEISNISDAMQVKLMRAIEDQKFNRVGSTKPVSTDIRIITASNRDLESMVENGEFRHDFYHRLNVVNIKTPTLAERREDIPSLVEAFVAEFVQRHNKKVQGFDTSSMKNLFEANWQGNIRELRNVVERCVILSDGPVLHWQNKLSADQQNEETRNFSFPQSDFMPLEQLEQEYIEHVLEQAGGKKTRAAKILGIDKTTLWRKLRRYDGIKE